MSDRHVNKLRILLWILTVLTLAFIFGQSLISQSVSSKESRAITQAVVQPVHKAVTGTSVLPIEIRDIAHIIEFLLLGSELILLMKDGRMLARSLRAVSFCGLIALVDETLQYIPDRAPEVVDIWLDVLGAAVGVAVGAALIGTVRKRKKRKQAQTRI